MPITNNLIGFLIIAEFLYGCTTSKEIYYSYRVNTYTIDTVKHFIYSDNLISYSDYLFEFRNRMNVNRTVNGGFDSTSISYDTIGVYLLSGTTNKLYYEFDTFALKNKVVKIGILTDKQFGYKFTLPAHQSTSDVSFTPPKKKVINNIDCFITQIFSNNKTENDSMNVEMVLIKNETFNSLYKMNGVKFTDSNYCIVGLHIFFLKKKESFLQDIESMKPLTEKEKDICANMIKKSKLCVVDTIKRLH